METVLYVLTFFPGLPLHSTANTDFCTAVVHIHGARLGHRNPQNYLSLKVSFRDRMS